MFIFSSRKRIASHLFIVLTGVTIWSVTNPRILFEYASWKVSPVVFEFTFFCTAGMTPHWVPLSVMGVYCGLALGHIDVLKDHTGEPRRPYLQVPVTDAEHHPGQLLLHDSNDSPDTESPLCL